MDDTRARAGGDPADGGLPPGLLLDAEGRRDVEQRQPGSLLELRERLGDLFCLRTEGRPPRVYVADPAALRDIFVTHGGHLRARGPSLFRHLVGEESVAFLNGRPHRRVRRLLGRALAGQDPALLADAVERYLRGTLSPGAALPLAGFADGLTRRVIVTLLLGEGEEARRAAVEDSLERAMVGLHHGHTARLAGDAERAARADRAFTRARRDLDDCLAAEIAAARRGSPASSVLARLLNDPDGGEPTDADVRVHAVTLLVSGHETTSAALSWALLQAARAPWHFAGIRAEIAALPERAPAVALLGLPYLRAYCLEVLRLTPPVPNGNTRLVVSPFRAAGYTFRPGVEICPCIHNAHHARDSHSDPQRFAPERFIGTSPAAGTYLPFGIGSRRCPGESLALRELAIAVAHLARLPGLRIGTPDTTAPEPVSMGPTVRTPHAVIRRTHGTGPGP
ncbi:cytochrome P450 [Streptomyces yaizuensis]|uniref:Cytochrome P450 n=1 Tax=Streptomyces yaizuensis TaxID=2989713 RepID=A0ABQ5P8B1_9ACTN|nr:cytochrome P450 [Streptomyces sp. YSPA8]GLF98823.1 cytochrome P450 [Streptomyces sp. YSPA8]